ncbi:tetratricopeptide repeat-containing sensor histidine kinase [Flavobacterium sp. MK4S-17]|uniref:tetratricopeptide repeat-containing sensor histidine kinase n=1 Tax=Flavobacterium sp. MK4S-17 TaxID=2543737 RepID=UPI0013567C93|nr:tetratricopeptide repeat-containing sensor histidine kinase [Flavobacterium sp. MK4S-17]
MHLNRVIIIICLTVFSLNAYAQEPALTDSIRQSVKKESDYKKKIAILQKNIGEIYTNKYDETIELARLGYKLANLNNDKVNKGDFLRVIGVSFAKKGSIDSASIYYHKALDELQNSGNSEKLGLLYDDMARLYRKLRQPKRALGFYEKALKLYEAENNLEGIARINNESGVVFRDEGDYTEANKRFEKSLQIQRQRNDSVGIGYALEFIGYNQLLLKNYKKAESYLQQALEIRKKGKDDFALMLSYTALGEYYKETRQYSVSNEYFKKSNTIARKIKFADIQQYNYRQIMENYEALNNFREAFYSLKAFNTLNDSIYNAEKLRNVEEITTKYETAEKEKQILQHKAQITNRNFWIFGLVALAVIIGLIGFLLYKQQLLKNIRQQKDSELKLALEKIESQNRLQEQRLAISRDLHDNIGAQLSFIVSAIDTIKYYMSGKNEKLTHKLDTIGAFAKETIQELRDTIWAMNKSGITFKDLQARIANFIEKAKQSQHDISISFTMDDNISTDFKFTALQGLNIFRIIQEATNNALKHAEACHIIIRILKKENSICFVIQDDGKGFVENETETGNGLLNMRKRAEALGGMLDISSIQGKTSIFCTIPDFEASDKL